MDSYICAGLLDMEVEEAAEAALIISVYFCLCFVSISVTVTSVFIDGCKVSNRGRSASSALPAFEYRAHL